MCTGPPLSAWFCRIVTNIRTVLLHDRQELDNDLGGRADQNLTLASLLGVVHGVERIVEDGSLDHFEGWKFEILKSIEAKI